MTNDTFPNRLFIVRLHSALVVMMKLKCSNVPGFSGSIKTSTTKSLILSLNSRGLTKWGGLLICDITVSHQVSKLSNPIFISRTARRNDDV